MIAPMSPTTDTTAQKTFFLFSRPRARAMLFALLAGRRGRLVVLEWILRRRGRKAAGSGVGGAQPGGDAQTQIHKAALLAGQSHGANDEEHGIALQAVDETHDGGIVAADAGVHADFREAGAGIALRVLHAREAHPRGDLQLDDARVNRGVVGRDALLVEVL